MLNCYRFTNKPIRRLAGPRNRYSSPVIHGVLGVTAHIRHIPRDGCDNISRGRCTIAARVSTLRAKDCEKHGANGATRTRAVAIRTLLTASKFRESQFRPSIYLEAL